MITKKNLVLLDEKTFCFLLPQYEQIFNWFEKTHNLIIYGNIYYSFNKQKWGVVYTNYPDRENDILSTFFENKQDAYIHEINEALKLIKS